MISYCGRIGFKHKQITIYTIWEPKQILTSRVVIWDGAYRTCRIEGSKIPIGVDK